MIINIPELKQSLNCNEEFLIHLLEKFIQESGEDINRLKTATDEKKWPQVRGIAHKILSSTRIFYMDELSNLFEEIETAAERKVNVEQIPDKVTTIQKLWKEVMEEIAQSLQKLHS